MRLPSVRYITFDVNETALEFLLTEFVLILLSVLQDFYLLSLTFLTSILELLILNPWILNLFIRLFRFSVNLFLLYCCVY